MTQRNDLIAGGIGATIETAAAYMGLELLAPAAGFAGTAIAQHLLGRFQSAKKILRSEVERAGSASADFRDADQFAAGALRYMRAARDQVVDENLRILAQTMIGCAHLQELWVSDFLRYADILAPLSREELILIGTLMADHRQFYSTPRTPDDAPNLWKTVKEKLVDRFGGGAMVDAIAAQSQRSGLIAMVPGWDGGFFVLSPIGIKVREVVNIEAAIHGRER